MEGKEVLDSRMGRRGASPRCGIKGIRTRTLRVVFLKTDGPSYVLLNKISQNKQNGGSELRVSDFKFHQLQIGPCYL
ncbi:uncharacterized protein DS421_1g21330 [Arachis hypogaea]|nr:uncharacterized protein DS421_1g21330 [Arachis hypogaea]